MSSRILIIDDDPMMLEALSSMVEIRMNGLVVETCESAVAALVRIQIIDYDAIVSDVKMPDMDGLQLMERVLKLRPTTPTLLVTGHGDHDLAVQALTAGAYAFIPKPIDRDFFLAWLKRAIQLRQLNRTVEQQNEELERAVQARTEELAQTNQTLRHTQQQLMDATDAAECGLWDWHIPSGTLQWFGAHERLAGLLPGSFSGKVEAFAEILHGEDRDRVWRKLQETMARREERYSDEYRFVHPDGSVHWMLGTGRFYYEKGYAVRMTGVVQDITARRRAEEALRESRERLGATQTYAPIGIVETTLDGAYLSANEEFCRLSGYSQEELLSRTLQDLTHPEDFPHNHDLFQQLVAGEFPSFKLEKRYVRKDGSIVWADVRRTLIKDAHGKPQYVIGAIRDITERKQAEDALRGSEEQLELVINAVPALIFYLDAEQRYRSVNAAFTTWFGVPREDVLGRTVREFIGEEAWQAIGPHLGRAYAGETVEYETEAHYRHGRTRWIRPAYTPHRDAAGNVVGVVALVNDITAHKQAETALQLSEERFAGIVNLALDAIITVDADYRIVVFNPAAERMFRCSASGVLGSSLEQFIPLSSRDTHRAHMEEFGRSGRTSRAMGGPIRVIGRRADGEEFPLEASISSLDHAAGRFYTAILRDITERQRREEAQARLAAIVHSSDDAIIGKDLQSMITSWNHGAERLLAYRAEDIIGKSVTVIVPSDRREEEDRIISRIARGESIKHYETVRVRRDGVHVHVSLTISPLVDADGKVIGASTIMRDITDRKQAEERQALLMDVSRLALEQEDAGAALTRAVFDRVAPHLNADVCFNYRLASDGGSLQLVAGIGIPDPMLPAAQRLEIGQAFCGTAAASCAPVMADAERIASDAKGAFVRGMGVRAYACHPLFSHNGRVMGTLSFASTTRDSFTEDEAQFLQTICHFVAIAWERQAAAASLRESEERLSVLTTAMPQLVWSCSSTGECLFQSPQWETVTGQTVADSLGYGWLDMIHPEDRARTGREWEQAVVRGTMYQGEYRLRTREGTYRWFLARAEALRDSSGTVLHWIGTSTDIEDTKRAEAALRESEARLQAILDRAPAAIFIKDRDGRNFFMNEECARVLNVDRAQAVGKTEHELFPAALADRFRRNDVAIWESGKTHILEEQVPQADGLHTFLSHKFLLKDAMGTSYALCGIATDITPRYRMEDALRASEARLRLALDGADLGSWDVDVRTGAAVWNRRHALVQGYEPDLEPVTMDLWRARVHPDDLNRVLASVERAKREHGLFAEEHRLYRADTGELRWISLYGRFSYNDAGEPVRFSGVSLDITDRKRTEEEIRRLLAEAEQREQELREKQAQLVQSAKLASLGEMATGIAHEINNPLNNIHLILGNAQDRLKMGQLGVDKLDSLLEKVHAQIKRAATIVNHLRTFGRADSTPFEPIDLHTVVRSSLSLMAEQLRVKEIEVEVALASQDAFVCGNAIQLEQVFINLIGNARDALETSPHKRILLQSVVTDRHVAVTVADTGPGVPTELQARIFDPFFTTKDVGQGTGLGLSISYGILKDHGGTIAVESSSPNGAVFVVTLPLVS